MFRMENGTRKANMSKELSVETKDVVLKALAKSQANVSGQGWCHREPKKWMQVANHIIQGTTSANSFIKSGVCTRNFYYNTKAELLADEECRAVRNSWASEISAIQFQTIDTFRELQDKYSEAIQNGEIVIDGNELFKQAKTVQAFNDIHAKLTGNNIQRIEVSHKSTPQEINEMIANLPEADEVIDV